MFDGAYSKLERAKKHITDVEAVFQAFVKSHRYTVGISGNAQTGQILVRVNFNEPVPNTLALIIGDAIHNLRTALDHATWELIKLDSGTQDRTLFFPKADNRVNYEALCNGIKTPRNDTKKFFIGIAAYKGGAGNILYGLNSLDITDKHRILTPLARATTIPYLAMLNPSGKKLVEIRNCKTVVGAESAAFKIMKGPVGSSVVWDEYADPPVDIFFGEIEFFKFQPIIPALMHLLDAVTDTLGKFRTFVVARK